MKIYKYLFSISCVALGHATPAASDETYNMLNTFVMFQQSYCQADGNHWTGMDCEKRPKRDGSNPKNIVSNELELDDMAGIENIDITGDVRSEDSAGENN